MHNVECSADNKYCRTGSMSRKRERLLIRRAFRRIRRRLFSAREQNRLWMKRTSSFIAYAVQCLAGIAGFSVGIFILNTSITNNH